MVKTTFNEINVLQTMAKQNLPVPQQYNDALDFFFQEK